MVVVLPLSGPGPFEGFSGFGDLLWSPFAPGVFIAGLGGLNFLSEGVLFPKEGLDGAVRRGARLALAHRVGGVGGCCCCSCCCLGNLRCLSASLLIQSSKALLSFKPGLFLGLEPSLLVSLGGGSIGSVVGRLVKRVFVGRAGAAVTVISISLLSKDSWFVSSSFLANNKIIRKV